VGAGADFWGQATVVGKCVEADSRVSGYFLHTGKKKLPYSSFQSAPSSLPRSLPRRHGAVAAVVCDFCAFGLFSAPLDSSSSSLCRCSRYCSDNTGE